jgi:hypothetical protein
VEERGIESNSFNTVFGAWLGARVFLRRTLHKLSLQAAPSHRSIIASLWRARLSITLTREKFGLGLEREDTGLP